MTHWLIAPIVLPPLSGFLGKLLVLDAAYDDGLMIWIWVIVLSASLISILGFARAGSVLFWKAQSVESPDEAPVMQRPAALAYVAVGGLVALLIAHTVFAGQMHRYATATTAQLFAPEPYISTVVETPGKLSKPAGEAGKPSDKSSEEKEGH